MIKFSIGICNSATTHPPAVLLLELSEPASPLEWVGVDCIQGKYAEGRDAILTEVLVPVIAPDHDEVWVERLSGANLNGADLHDFDNLTQKQL